MTCPRVPGAPADLAASAAADAVTLSWSAPTTGGPVTGYRLWRQSGEAAFSVQGDDLAADALTYKDTAVTASTTYQYRLQAQAAVGPGLRTAAVSATTPAAPAPGVPADVACNYRHGRVTVYWDPPPTGGPVTHYLLWQQIDSGAWALTGDPVATGRSYYSYRFAAPADADTLAYEGAGGGARRGGAPLRPDLAGGVQLSVGGQVRSADPAAALALTRLGRLCAEGGKTSMSLTCSRLTAWPPAATS